MKIYESDVGKIVLHKLTKERVIIIFVSPFPGYRRIGIRRSDYTVVEVSQEELEEETQ